MRNIYILAGKPEGNRTPEKPRRGWEDRPNTKMDLKEI
jgi:hypothetical protein